MAKGVVNQDYVQTFGIEDGAGAGLPGVLPGAFTALVRAPGGATTSPAVSDAGGGQYQFTIPQAFTLANGVGEYGWTVFVASATPFAEGGVGDVVQFELTDLDGIRGADARDLTELAGAGWVAADNLVQAHNKLDGIQADIDNFENITRFKVSIPPLERPEAGTTLHEIYFNLKDDQGLPVDADGAVTIQATSFGGVAGDRDGRLSSTSMTNLATGRYRVTFSVANTDILEGIHFFLSWAEGGNANNVDKSSHVIDSNEVGYLASDRVRDDQIAVETAAILADTAAIQPLVDVAVSTRSSHNPGDVDTTLSGTHGAGSWEGATAPAVATAVWSEALPGAFAAGEAGNIVGNRLDTNVGSRAAPGDAMTLTAAAIQAIVDGVLDEALSGHVGVGSVGEALLVAAGHAGLHAVLDGGAGFAQPQVNANNNLTTSRLRIFATAAAASGATAGAADGADGELKRINLTAGYVNGNQTPSIQVVSAFTRTGAP